MAHSLLMSPERVRRTLTRFAYQIVERNRGAGNITVFGVLTRGVALAETVASAIGDIEGNLPHVHSLDVTPFRDDIDEPPPAVAHDPPPDVGGRHVILVDDVLFTGRTVRAAIDGILFYGRPASIQLAVLIDRGHREYPIQPDFVGQHVPTKHTERVVVELAPEVQVYLEET